MRGVPDCVADCVWLTVRQATEGARRKLDRRRVYLCGGVIRKRA